MHATVEMLMKDNKKRDEAINRSASVIDGVHNENKILKAKIRERDELIDELRRQEKTTENKILALQTDNLNVTKLRTIETKLRAELEGLKHENELILEDSQKTETAIRKQLLALENDLKEAKLLKEKILSEIGELSNSERVSNSLVEDYIGQLREVEKENAQLNETITKMREERTKQIEKQKEEMQTVSDANKRLIDMLKNSKQPTVIRTEDRPPKSFKQELLGSVLLELLQMHDDLNRCVSRIAAEEADDLELLKRRAEENLRLLAGSDFKSEENRQLNALLAKVAQLEEVILQQNDFIHELTEQLSTVTSYTSDTSVMLGEMILEHAQDASESFDGHRRFMKSCSVNLGEVLRTFQDDTKRIQDYLSRVEGYDTATVTSMSVVDAVRDLVSQLNGLKREKTAKERDFEELTESKDELLGKLEEILQELQEKNQELNILNEAYDELEQENHRLLDQVRDAGSQADEQRRQLRSKITELETENDRLIQKCEDIALRSVHKQKASREEDPAQLASKEDRDLNYQLKLLKNELSSLEYKLKEKEFDAENLHSQLAQRKEKLGQLAADLQASKEKESSLLAELFQLRKENADLRRHSLSTTNRSLDPGDLDRSLNHNHSSLHHTRPTRRPVEYSSRFGDPDSRHPLFDDRPNQKRFVQIDDDYEDLEDFERKFLSGADFD